MIEVGLCASSHGCIPTDSVAQYPDTSSASSPATLVATPAVISSDDEFAAGWTTTWPPQYPSYYKVKYFSQPADHSNSESAARFPERYLENATHWGGPGAPILFYTGAEGSGVDAIFPHSGYVMALAEKLNALVIFAEMRYFGTS